MSDNLKRRFWQIHLSTAVVLMFVAGGMLGPNVVPRHKAWYNPVPEEEGPYRDQFEKEMNANNVWILGWPIIISAYQDDPEGFGIKYVRVDAASIVSNIFIGLLFTLVVTVCAEFLIRRRERGRT